MRTAIKKWCVGSPCQASLDVMEELVRDHGLKAADVACIHVTLPARRVQITKSPVPNLNLSHLMALFLVEGGANFASVHDAAWMADPAVLALRNRVRIEERPGAGRRGAGSVASARAAGALIRHVAATCRRRGGGRRGALPAAGAASVRSRPVNSGCGTVGSPSRRIVTPLAAGAPVGRGTAGEI